MKRVDFYVAVAIEFERLAYFTSGVAVGNSSRWALWVAIPSWCLQVGLRVHAARLKERDT